MCNNPGCICSPSYGPYTVLAVFLHVWENRINPSEERAWTEAALKENADE